MAEAPQDLESATLVVAVLTTESSYDPPVERPAQSVADTVQWWLTRDEAWRIRTYAIDHDIHVHSVPSIPGDPIEFAKSNTQKHYGDVLSQVHVLRIPDASDAHVVLRVLREAGLAKGDLELAQAGFAFWNPDGARYRSRSRPQ